MKFGELLHCPGLVVHVYAEVQDRRLGVLVAEEVPDGLQRNAGEPAGPAERPS